MLTELRVQGFKSLRDVRIPFAPGVTVFVGANNTGKSAALQALEVLGRGAAMPPSVVDVTGFASSGTEPSQLSINAFFGNRQRRFVRHQLIGGDASAESQATDRFLRALRVFDLNVTALRTESPLASQPTLARDGSNLAAVLDALASEAPDLRDRIDAEVIRVAAGVKRITTPVGPSGRGKVVAVQETSGHVYRADALSDGLLLFIALSTIVETSLQRETLLAFEEPDRGIHPRRIRDVVDQFRRVANAGTQVVLTTHSPLVVDEFRDSPESIVLFDRDESGTRVQRLSDHPDWKAGVFSGEPLGDLWYSGLLGGVPR